MFEYTGLFHTNPTSSFYFLDNQKIYTVQINACSVLRLYNLYKYKFGQEGRSRGKFSFLYSVENVLFREVMLHHMFFSNCEARKYL